MESPQKSPTPQANEGSGHTLNSEDHSASNGGHNQGSGKKDQASILIEMAQEGTEFFHDSEGTGYANVFVDDHYECHAIRGSSYRDLLQMRFYRRFGRVPTDANMKEAVSALNGQARMVGPERPVFRRVAEMNGKHYLDLCNAQREVVEISALGWRIIQNSPVMFIRSRGMLPLPTPVQGGDVQRLFKFLNISDRNSQILVVAWLLGALRSKGPFPLLAVNGEHGTSKTTTARVLKETVDPSIAPSRTTPKNEQDLVISATNSHILNFDNLSGLMPWLADAFCRLATGGGFATRKLYTDGEESVFDVSCPVILNGISEFMTRPDLVDRAIALFLEQIPATERKPEKTLREEFEAEHPGILGGLLTAMVGAVRNLASVTANATSLPRMADFALWATAAEAGMGWEKGSFLAAYDENRLRAYEIGLESSPLAMTIIAMAGEGVTMEGSATEILLKIEGKADIRSRTSMLWPKAVKNFTDQLRRLAPALKAVGVEVVFHRSNSKRWIKIKLSENCVTNVTSVTRDEERSDASDDGDEDFPKEIIWEEI